MIGFGDLKKRKEKVRVISFIFFLQLFFSSIIYVCMYSLTAPYVVFCRMTEQPLTCYFDMDPEPWTPGDYQELKSRIQPPQAGHRTLTVLVFEQNGSNEYQYYSATSKDDLQSQLNLRKGEKVIMGSVLHVTYAKWKPFVSIAKSFNEDIWDVENCVDMTSSTMSYAAWVVSSCIKDPVAVDLRQDRYDHWGHPIVVDKKWDLEERVNAARRAFGERYQFEHDVGPGRGTILVVENPDHAWYTAPGGTELLRCPIFIADCHYTAYWNAVHSMASTAETFHQLCEQGGFTADRAVPLEPGCDVGWVAHPKKWGSMRLARTRAFTSSSESSHIEHRTGFCEWICTHTQLLENEEAMSSFVNMQALLTEAELQYKAGRDLSFQKYNWLMSIMDDVRAPSCHGQSFPSLLTVMPDVQLRPEQTAVLAEVLRRETDPRMSLEKKLYVKLADGTDDEHDLYWSCFTNRFAFRSVHVAPKMYGGLIVAGLGWGKTILTFALIAASELRGSTLVVCPTVALALQWKKMCDDLTGLMSYAHVGKKLLSGTDPLPDVDVVFTTNKFVQNDAWILSHEWTRVIYDEVHDFNTTLKPDLQEKVSQLKSTIQWGLTATHTRAERPTISGMMKVLLQSVPHSPKIGWNPIQQAVFLKLFAVSAPAVSLPEPWSVTMESVDISMPPSLRERYNEASHALHQQNWSDTRVYTRILRSIAAGFANTPVTTSDRFDASGEGTSNGKKMKMTEAFVEEECPICNNTLEESYILSCGHMFCKTCIFMWAYTLHKNNCPTCRSQIRSPPVTADVYNARLLSSHESTPAARHQQPLGVDEYRVDKVLEMVTDSDPTDKFIVFSHYSDSLERLGKKMKRNGIGFGRFSSGSEKTLLTTFQEDSSCRVLLLNVRSTSAGLNLTAANRVVFMEPSIDSTKEKQAIARAARNGQVRDVRVQILKDPDVGY